MKLIRFCQYCACAVTASIFAAPVLWLVLVSLMERRDLFRSPPALWFRPTFNHYRATYVDGPGLQEVAKTVLACSAAAVLATVLAVLFIITRRLAAGRFPRIDGILLPALAIPGSVVAIPYFFFAKSLRVGASVAFVLGVGTIGLMVAVLILSGLLADTRRSCVDTLTVYREKRLFSNVWFLAWDARSAVMVAAIFAFLVGWHDLAIGVVTADSTFRPLNVSIIGLITPIGTYWGEIAARSMPSVLVAFLLAMLADDRTLRGFTFGR